MAPEPEGAARWLRDQRDPLFAAQAVALRRARNWYNRSVEALPKHLTPDERTDAIGALLEQWQERFQAIEDCVQRAEHLLCGGALPAEIVRERIRAFGEEMARLRTL
jgi:hypothetical protein